MKTTTAPPEAQNTTKLVLTQVMMESIAEFCKRHQICELMLFGSAVRGEMRPHSDLDVLVAFEPEARVGFMALGRMTRELSELMGRQVDLVPVDGLNPAIRTEVLSEAESLFAA